MTAFVGYAETEVLEEVNIEFTLDRKSQFKKHYNF
jgi:hypothetical protein